MRKLMVKLFFQGPLKVHLFSSLEGAYSFIKPCSAAGATSLPKKQTKVKHTLLCNRSQLSLVSPEKEKQRGWDRAEGEGCPPMHRDQNAGCSREVGNTYVLRRGQGGKNIRWDSICVKVALEGASSFREFSSM